MARSLTAIFVIASGPVIALFPCPERAWAQAGYYVTPSFSISEAYDDNIFLQSSGHQNDFISRFTPGLRAGYQSEPFALLGNYSFRSALYASHPELDNPTENQVGGLDLKYRPNEVLSFSFAGSYSVTSLPSELNQPNVAIPSTQVTTGILSGRQTATFYGLGPSVEYRFNRLTRSSANYNYSVSSETGISTTAHSVALQLDRDITPQDTGTLKSDFRHFETQEAHATASAGQSGAVTSYALTPGWAHRFTQRWDASIQAGPRVTEGAVDAEVSATVNWHFELGTASFGYARTEATAVGIGGVFRTDSVFASLAVAPIRFLHLSLSPRYVENTPEGAGPQTTGRITVYGVDATATYQLTRWLNARLNYQFASQRQSGTGTSSQDILHNVVTIGLDVVYRQRVY